RELPPHVETVFVEAGADAADFRIVQLAKQGDVVVTQDYGLASLLLPKGCKVIHHKGFEYSNENINHLLETRYMGSKIRKSGGRKGRNLFQKKMGGLLRNCLSGGLKRVCRFKYFTSADSSAMLNMMQKIKPVMKRSMTMDVKFPIGQLDVPENVTLDSVEEWL